MEKEEKEIIKKEVKKPKKAKKKNAKKGKVKDKNIKGDVKENIKKSPSPVDKQNVIDNFIKDVEERSVEVEVNSEDNITSETIDTANFNEPISKTTERSNSLSLDESLEVVEKALMREYITLSLLATLIIIGVVVYIKKKDVFPTIILDMAFAYLTLSMVGIIMKIYMLNTTKKAMTSDADNEWKIESIRLVKIGENGKPNSLEIRSDVFDFGKKNKNKES